MNVLSLFDGISCGQVAFERARIKVENYFASEIKEIAIKVAMNNYPKTIQLGDVRELNVSKIPKVDILIGGSPCQNLSKGRLIANKIQDGLFVLGIYKNSKTIESRIFSFRKRSDAQKR